MRMLAVAAGIAALCSGCARREVPVPAARASLGFFLVSAEPPLLTPPHGGVPATIRAKDVEACPGELGGLPIERARGAIRVEADEARLEGGPAGWLGLWGVELERLGCLATGDGDRLARRLAHSRPLPLGAERKLLEVSEGRDGYLDLRAGHRLRTVRPVFREGAAEQSAIAEVGEAKAGPPGSLTVEVRAADDLIGYERAWYEFEPTKGGARLRLLAAAAVVNGEETPLPKPLEDWMEFDGGALYFRLLFLSRRTEIAENDILLLGESTPVALEDLTQDVRAAPSTCAARRGCKRAPKDTAVLPFVTVEVDGEALALAPGSTVRGALDALDAAAWSAELAAAPRVWKPSAGRMIPVRSEGVEVMLELPLLGGERIWTKGPPMAAAALR